MNLREKVWDLRKTHLNGKRFELLAQVVVQKSILNSINRLGSFESHLLETNPNKDGTTDVI